ncbi:hypothetical protein [Streptomyces johnsoniae]|uniref:Translation initiation factor IF-2 n=1 Tax=Streptomyces johnsoniae TaxID=3075532 RepID=A0ABU2S5R4_9ACTN|nr:hypothetical protein [Streptomyces sp. DSM 41886]MDT0444308.1 hypothetical protein [Streptomyces sp. DSM 41886]
MTGEEKAGRALTTERLRVPVGADAERWVTRRAARRALFVVHNVTSATRLLDVLPLLDSDPRLQLLATCTGSSPFLAGVPEALETMGLPVLPWEQAVRLPVHLAVTASYGGGLHALPGRLVTLSHGVGYNKKLRSASGADGPAAFGFGPEWQLHGGRPIAAATVLSHPEQLERLAAACPEAAPTAVLAGDPCYDRILAELPLRERFRRAFGVADGQRLVVVNSTWGQRSLFGDGGEADPLLSLLPRLTAELPADEYRTAAVLHPNVWHGHGPGQVRAWLAEARRGGLTLIPPLGPWRQALIAADCVIGDHGSVTFYAAAIGRPVLMAAFPDEDLDPGSPVASLGRAAPRLAPHRGLRAQLDELMGRHVPGRYAALGALSSSAPGGSAALLRTLFYDLLGLPEPHGRPAALARLPLPAPAAEERTAPLRVLTRVCAGAAPEVAVARYAGATAEPAADGFEDAHTVVHEDGLDVTRLEVADVIVRYGAVDDPRTGPPRAWAAEVLERHRHCRLAAYVTGPDSCTVLVRGGRALRLTAEPEPSGRVDLCDPAAYASALHAWLTAGSSLPGGLVVRTGGTRHRVRVEPDG